MNGLNENAFEWRWYHSLALYWQFLWRHHRLIVETGWPEESDSKAFDFGLVMVS
jgi:hypothetical protein